jgi:hypothetical protein
VSDPNRGDHLPMALPIWSSSVERQRAPNSGVSPSPREVSGSPYCDRAEADLKEDRRAGVDPNRPPLPGKGTSCGASPSRSGTLLVDLERQDRRQDRRCPGLRRAVLLGTGSPLMDEPRYRRVGGAQYGDPVEGHAADQAPGWPARCGATAEGLPTPRYPTTSSMSLCSRPS